MTSLLDQFRDHIAAKPREALLKLRTELLTTSVGGSREMTETEREVAMMYAKAIEDEILHRAGVASSSSATAEYDQAEDVKRVAVQPATTTRGGSLPRRGP